MLVGNTTKYTILPLIRYGFFESFIDQTYSLDKVDVKIYFDEVIFRRAGVDANNAARYIITKLVCGCQGHL